MYHTMAFIWRKPLLIINTYSKAVRLTSQALLCCWMHATLAKRTSRPSKRNPRSQLKSNEFPNLELGISVAIEGRHLPKGIKVQDCCWDPDPLSGKPVRSLKHAASASDKRSGTERVPWIHVVELGNGTSISVICCYLVDCSVARKSKF
ncbi:hypothetical protein K456DRAFT_1700962 [Colletotrichum gloeosporioides 23]|nr:hypothetical protein K456DRAFT_1700962 [Colletotrichum gloeosporioides 23]